MPATGHNQRAALVDERERRVLCAAAVGSQPYAERVASCAVCVSVVPGASLHARPPDSTNSLVRSAACRARPYMPSPSHLRARSPALTQPRPRALAALASPARSRARTLSSGLAWS
jgi:hypothetical protein